MLKKKTAETDVSSVQDPEIKPTEVVYDGFVFQLDDDGHLLFVAGDDDQLMSGFEVYGTAAQTQSTLAYLVDSLADSLATDDSAASIALIHQEIAECHAYLDELRA